MRPVYHRLLRQSALLTLALAFVACSDTDNPMRPSVQGLYTTPTGLVTANPPQIFIGAGDISSCSNNNDEATAKLLDANPVGTVYNLGDDAYDNGAKTEFTNCYDPTWGRHKNRTKPAPGNHEYNTPGASGYYWYFGAAAGDPTKGYYSYDLGAWHIIVLNAYVSTGAGSAQDTWLKADLAAHPDQCKLAYYHPPLYSSTGGSGSGGVTYSGVRQFVNDLYAAHADLILSGHRHFYERLAPMNPSGGSDPVNGVRQIIAGTGGIGGGSLTNVFPTSQVREGSTFGVLKLYLYDDSYAWKFLPVAGKTFTDSGSTACHSSGGGSGGGVVSASNSTVSASPTSFTVGTGSSTITVTARDDNGATMSGAAVSLSASGSGNTLTPSSGSTNGSGVFTSTLTSSVAEGKTITATINSTVINQTASVTVNPSGGGGNGTIVHTLLTSGGNGVNQSVYTTASIATAANALVTVAIRMRRSSGALTPTVSGGGMASWAQVASVDYDPVSTPTSRLLVFRAMSGAPTSGPVTITFASSISNVEWAVSQWSGVDQTGTNGSGAIGQTGSATGDATTSLSKALAPFGNANNVALGVVGATTAPPAVNPGGGFTEIVETTSGESTLLETESGVNLNTVSASLSKSANAGLLAVELKAGAGGATVSATLSTVSASPTAITAGGSGSTITVTAKDGSGNPISGATVVLAATGSGNTLTQPSATTNGSGVATGTLSSTVAEVKDVSATINGVAITQHASVTVNPAGPSVSASLSAVGASPASFSAGGSSTITVTVKDGSGNPMSGIAVTISATGSGNTLTQPATTTDGSGVTTGTFSSTGAGSHTITAVAGGVTLNQQPVVTVTAGPADAGQSTVTALPTSIIQGTGSSAITVTVKDAFGNPVSGSNVVLAATGTGNTLTGGGATNGSGVATGSLSSTVAEVKTVSATAGGTAITQTAAVTVTPPGSGGTIAQTLLTSGHDPTNTSVFTTASIAPAPNALVTVAVLTHQSSAAAPSPTLTGGGMASWTVVASVAYNGATPLDRLTIFRAMSSAPGSGPITITSSVTVSNCQWIVSQWSGVDNSGTNGSGAIVQTASASGTAVTSLTATLAAFASANDVGYGAFGAASATAVITAGSGFTTIDQQPSGESSIGDLFAEWALNTPAVTASWPSKNAGALGVEIRAAP